MAARSLQKILSHLMLIKRPLRSVVYAAKVLQVDLFMMICTYCWVYNSGSIQQSCVLPWPFIHLQPTLIRRPCLQ